MDSITLVWIASAVSFVIIEVGHPGFFYCLAGSFGAFAAAYMSVLQYSLHAQLVCFGLTSLSAFFVLRRLVQRYFLRKPLARTNSCALVGQRGIVIVAPSGSQFGSGKIQGEVWSLSALHQEVLVVGDTVEVVDVQGCHLIVKRY